MANWENAKRAKEFTGKATALINKVTPPERLYLEAHKNYYNYEWLVRNWINIGKTQEALAMAESPFLQEEDLPLDKQRPLFHRYDRPMPTNPNPESQTLKAKRYTLAEIKERLTV